MPFFGKNKSTTGCFCEIINVAVDARPMDILINVDVDARPMDTLIM
jgi:hypothetical protein